MSGRCSLRSDGPTTSRPTRYCEAFSSSVGTHKDGITGGGSLMAHHVVVAQRLAVTAQTRGSPGGDGVGRKGGRPTDAVWPPFIQWPEGSEG